jgi:hypothetical protein
MALSAISVVRGKNIRLPGSKVGRRHSYPQHIQGVASALINRHLPRTNSHKQAAIFSGKCRTSFVIGKPSIKLGGRT